MQLPTNADGCFEFVQAASRDRNSSCAFRAFRSLAPDLVAPRLLICPADSRQSAPTFGLLQNENLSYFVTLNARASEASSILAGDRNLTNDWIPPAGIMQFGPHNALRWTHELHKFKGNLLFADAHVEQRNSVNLQPQFPFQAVAEFALPIGRGSLPKPTPLAPLGAPPFGASRSTFQIVAVAQPNFFPITLLPPRVPAGWFEVPQIDRLEPSLLSYPSEGPSVFSRSPAPGFSDYSLPDSSLLLLLVFVVLFLLLVMELRRIIKQSRRRFD
jgi:prepilin-type processing-associated H-X9-DG protein